MKYILSYDLCDSPSRQEDFDKLRKYFESNKQAKWLGNTTYIINISDTLIPYKEARKIFEIAKVDIRKDDHIFCAFISDNEIKAAKIENEDTFWYVK